jgi:hypothetical protein
MQSRTPTVLSTHTKTSSYRVPPVPSSFVSLSSFLLLISYSVPAFLNVTALPLQFFYKGCVQSNQVPACSRLMHSTRCGGAVCPYEAVGTRQAQGTLVGCAGLHNETLEDTEHVCMCLCTYVCTYVYMYVFMYVYMCLYT